MRAMTTSRWSPELETLDQLQSGDVKLDVIRKVWPDDERFLVGVKSLAISGDVLLLTSDAAEVPQWQLRQLFDHGSVLTNLASFALRLTEQGTARIA